MKKILNIQDINKVYDEQSFSPISSYQAKFGSTIIEYVNRNQTTLNDDLNTYIDKQFDLIKDSLNNSQNKATQNLLMKANNTRDIQKADNLYLITYVYAIKDKELNDLATEVIAPVLYYMYYRKNLTKSKLIESLKVASLFSAIAKNNHLSECKYLTILIAILFNYDQISSDNTLINTAVNALDNASKKVDNINKLTLFILNGQNIANYSQTLEEISDEYVDFDEYVTNHK